jgi:polysaccharide biosynthesis protein PslH
VLSKEQQKTISYQFLYVVRKLPYPWNAGARIRQFQILSAYTSVAEVSLLFYYEDQEELARQSALNRYCSNFYPIPFSWVGRPAHPGVNVWLKEWKRPKKPWPFQAGVLFTREMQETLERIAPAFDLIHLSRLDMVPHAENVLRGRSRVPAVVLDLDDDETLFKRRALHVSPPRRWDIRLAEHVDSILLAGYQKRIISQVDRVMVCSVQDQHRIGINGRTVLIPNGAELQQGELPDESDGKTLLCLGTYGHWPNEDALFFFVKEILPLIHRRISDVRVLVVGGDMPPRVSALHNGRGILVSADVPCVKPYYRRATVSVVPLRIGAGTRLKILESFSLGRPVVATSLGCEGLEVTHGRHLLVADTPAAFAQACVRLLQDSVLRTCLASEGRTLVEEKYSWASIRSRVADMAGELLAGVKPIRS